MFGQTTIQGYFAGSTLFAPETKTLAISTLLDNPETPVFTVHPSGNIVTGAIKYGTGMNVQIESFYNGILSFSVRDDRAGDIARITYPAFSSDVSYNLCSYAETDARCDRDTLAFVPANTTVTYKE